MTSDSLVTAVTTMMIPSPGVGHRPCGRSDAWSGYQGQNDTGIGLLGTGQYLQILDIGYLVWYRSKPMGYLRKALHNPMVRSGTANLDTLRKLTDRN